LVGEWMVRFEPIAAQLSGGQLLRPVQTLVDTIIFSCSARENANRIHHPFDPGTLCLFPVFIAKIIARFSCM